MALFLLAGGACAQEDGRPAPPEPAEPPRPHERAEPGEGAALSEGGLLDAALALAREDHPELDEAAARAEIERLAERYRRLAPADAPPAARARAFATLLFEEEGFAAVDDLTSLEALHVDSVLRRRQGYCLSLSLVALAVAERAGEPLFGVALPNHFFVRWDDGTARRNLELTRRGAEIPDEELRARLGDGVPSDTLYLRNLTPQQVVGVLRHNRAYAALAAGRPAGARRDLDAALLLVPELPEVHRTRGILHGEAREWDAAIAAFERALALHPDDVDALLNLALCRHARGDLAAALSDLAVVRLLDPEHERARRLEEEWRAQAAHVLPAGVRALDDPPPGLAPGLLGHYFRGTAFERQLATRVDAGGLDFDWGRAAPHPRLPRDGSSIRWTGWFSAPVTGLYTLFVVGNDGVRIRLGERLVVDEWHDVGYESWTGSADVELHAGWHPLVVEYFDAGGNARLWCAIGVEGREKPLELERHLFHVAE